MTDHRCCSKTSFKGKVSYKEEKTFVSWCRLDEYVPNFPKVKKIKVLKTVIISLHFHQKMQGQLYKEDTITQADSYSRQFFCHSDIIIFCYF